MTAPPNDQGFTLVETLFALVLGSVVTASALGLFTSNASVFHAQPEAVDMQERLRGAADVLMRELTMAGAGSYEGADAGSLIAAFAPVLPRRVGVAGDPPDVARADAITIAYVPTTHVQTFTGEAPQAGGVVMADAPNCVAGQSACGVHAGMTIALFDRTGQHEVFTVDGIDGQLAQLRPHANATDYLYPAGSHVVEVESHSFYLNATNHTLREYDGLSSDVPLADNVVDLSFEYWGDPRPPVAPVPPTGIENCLYDSAGNPKPMPVLSGPSGQLVSLPLTLFNDGPWCGVGEGRFDADLLRVRAVRVVLRVQAAVPGFRAQAPAFLEPGTSVSGQRFLPDLSATFEVWPRNMSLTP